MERSCITCANFAWWDGDFCCVYKLKLFGEEASEKLAESLKKKASQCMDWKAGTVDIIELNEAYFKKQ